jgi:hypothetical protein
LQLPAAEVAIVLTQALVLGPGPLEATRAIFLSDSSEAWGPGTAGGDPGHFFARNSLVSPVFINFLANFLKILRIRDNERLIFQNY